MSRWQNLPCAKCATDTTHYAGKCRECGTLFVYPNKQRLKALRRHALALRFGKSPWGAFAQARKAMVEPYGSTPDFLKPARPSLRVGRERVKA